MDHWKEAPLLGSRFCLEKAVDQAMSAVACGSGKLPVLGSPALIAALEEASWRCVETYLSEGYDTVGTHFSFDHVKATALNALISCTAELVKIEGRSLTFKIFAEDEYGLIGHGYHRRFIVNSETFMARI